MDNKFSKGISYQPDLSRYRQFGTLVLHDYFLNNNKLLVKYPSLAPVKGLPQTKITDEMKSCIKTLIRVQEINYNLLKDLESYEKDMFELLMKRSKLGDELNFDRDLMDYTEADILKMYEVQCGLIEAGDDSEKLKKDLNKTIKLLRLADKITDDQMAEMLLD